MSRQEAWPEDRTGPYRCCLSAPDDTLRVQTNTLPVLDEEADLPSDDTGSEVSEYGVRDREVNSRKLVFKVTGDSHFFDTINSLACRLFFIGDRRMFAPFFQRWFCEERLQHRIILDNWVVPGIKSVSRLS